MTTSKSQQQDLALQYVKIDTLAEALFSVAGAAGLRTTAPGALSRFHDTRFFKAKEDIVEMEPPDPYFNGYLFGQQPAPDGPPVTGIPRLAVLAARASYGTGDQLDGSYPVGPLVPFCAYCHRLGLLYQEAGIPHEEYAVDGRDKAKWFLDILNLC